jgi:predicted ribosome quality control (RQC) complex YloA/Tae2 family protein
MKQGAANPLRFREFVTSSGELVFGGKDEDQNDSLVKTAPRKNVMLHTKAPGSPFCSVGDKDEVSTKDIEEAAVFCARYSQDWRDNRKDVVVQQFIRSDMTKDQKMKAGTWGVGKVIKKIKVKKEDIENFNKHKEDVQRADRKR